MCGRYSQTADLKTLSERFQARARVHSIAARYNIAPTQDAPVVISEEGGERELVLLRWGLVPFWAKDASIGNRMINARAETLREKPSFRRSLERRRCLVAADGFYEWRKAAGARAKVPMRFTLDDGEPFALAGLWDVWKGPDGKQLRTFTIVTTKANALLAPVHDRMPVILDRAGEDLWLDPGLRDSAELCGILKPFDAGRMQGREISTLVNSPANDRPEILRPAS